MQLHIIYLHVSRLPLIARRKTMPTSRVCEAADEANFQRTHARTVQKLIWSLPVGTLSCTDMRPYSYVKLRYLKLLIVTPHSGS